MASNQDSASLLDALKQLYSRFMALHAESRARSSLNSSNTAGTQKIVSSFSQCIDNLSARATTNAGITSEQQQIPKPKNHSPNQATINRDSSSRVEPGELSKHLKKTHRQTGISLDTGDKLMQSTWEHFHAAIRLARQGDKKGARLHMELSNNALNEAAHYLSESEYSRFSKDVMKALEEINSET